MKILNIIDIPWNSGLAAYAFEQSAALAALSHEIYFAAPENSAAAAFAQGRSFPLTLIPPRKSNMLLGALYRLKKLAETRGIDIVNAHTGKAQTLAWMLSLISSRRFSLVRTKADAKRPAAGFVPGRPALILAGSAFIKGMYARAGADPGVIEVIYQGIAPPPETAAPEGDALKIGILGRLDPVKGHACFLQAAGLALKRFPSAEFLIAGQEENLKYSALERVAGEAGAAGRIKYLGRVADGPTFCLSCDIGVIPSLGSEAVSRAALEWLAAGRPLIASSVGSLPEFVSKEWLFAPGDAAGLAGQLLRLLGSREARLAAAAENRAKAVKDFSPGTFARNTESALIKAMKGPVRL